MNLDGPDELRSRGSPIMSRLLYQAELRALRKSGFTLSIKCYRILQYASENLKAQGVKMHKITDIREIADNLYEAGLIPQDIIQKVRIQTGEK